MQFIPKTVPENQSQIIPVKESPPPEVVTFDVGGMKCAGCAASVERQLMQHSGVISACVNLAVEVATIECQPGTVDAEALAKKLTNNGFPSQSRLGENQREAEAAAIERRRQEIRQQINQLSIALILIILSGLGHILGTKAPILSNIWFHWGLATLALLLPGRPIIVDGCRSLWRNAPNMNTLVALGAVTAYTASNAALLFPRMGWECFFDEPVMLLGFILLGKTLEQQARRRAASALQALIALQPATARLVDFKLPILDLDSQELPANSTSAVYNPQYIEIPADRVRVGEWLQVLPGEKFPVDGEVCEGKTTVDESMLTGESMPVLKQPGDTVAAGTINKSGAVVMRATRTGQETTVAQMVALVQAAQTRKAPIQHLADTVAGYFVYGVMAISALTFLFWYFAGTHIWPSVLLGHNMGHGASGMGHGALGMGNQLSITDYQSPLLLSLKLAIAVLVIACPCALGLATPTAILVGSGIGAERGLLIRGGDVLERVHQLDTVVFDKTGTLTTGNLTLTDYLPIFQNSELDLNSDINVGNKQDICSTISTISTIDSKLLQIAAAVERGACHPIAAAIVLESQQQGLPLLAAEDFYTEPGFGVSALVEGQRVFAGNAEWMNQQGVAVAAELLESCQGKTAVYVASGGVLLGVIGLKDTLRPDAKAAVDRLRGMGLRVIMLTGDTASAALVVAQQLGLAAADVLAEVRPEGKARAIASLQAQGCKVAVVGDGINDAPALAQADVGIGLHCGTDVAVETAQIVLMRNALMDVVESIDLGRATFNKIRQNLFWAFAYNTLGIPIAAGLLLPATGILLSPAAAGAFMAFSSVSVVTNSLLLRRKFRG
ncbi:MULTISPECIES: heavy metal translocating P-type ATPase [unclassified Microcoleus]|uniref:heavy metal translocating P-type ATPase n=1 Tax=unclassified Microcoleus TaxID=2642155 RepID=UPI001DBE2235|nr:MULTISPECIES: heavy metal translocating P-type ATPase [unclassified Microcoleus]MCC3467718.1 copper-translocating P-type ATPase [Microcoleus sp. PH2017_06_SFM_O_A]TAE52286.1 MAG: copper-translocating P-type ATPase [Oscillatoriales cyanobacterium]MCC3415651.1 copper-translocating P-type ATPase [Microcoleus sp. PH2017_02_FOX_O_A]MCC3436364.1 copper-translocating P-type ATPase [Microcoleus sp. PH2017_05_CCC_O_A]MCC3471651.1 copper-translocating P-type ATPase [Microcoleus sp. PH2017_13_LAR_U_A]